MRDINFQYPFLLLFYDFILSIFFLGVDSYYQYNLENPESLKYTKLDLNTLRIKRDINQLPQKSSVNVTSDVAPTPTPTSTSSQNKQNDKSDIEIDSTPHLLGVNGTGQRKDYSNNATNASNPLNSDNKTAVHSFKLTEISELMGEDEKVVDTIDESDEAINKTINAHSTNNTLKNEYFQYYNSSTIVDKAKSDEYWSENRNYTVSTILSRSHRRAIVSGKFIRIH